MHIYMESRKMILMNLFVGSSGNTDIQNRLTNQGVGSRKERVGQMERVAWKHIH